MFCFIRPFAENAILKIISHFSTPWFCRFYARISQFNCDIWDVNMNIGSVNDWRNIKYENHSHRQGGQDNTGFHALNQVVGLTKACAEIGD